MAGSKKEQSLILHENGSEAAVVSNAPIVRVVVHEDDAAPSKDKEWFPRSGLLLNSDLDSLPYLDSEEEMRAMRPTVEALVTEEAKRGRLSATALLARTAPGLINTRVEDSEILRRFMTVDAGGQRTTPAQATAKSLSRIAECTMVPSVAHDGGEIERISDISRALHQTTARSEYARHALVSTQLLSTTEASDTWRRKNEQIDAALKTARARVQKLKADIVVTNRERKNHQRAATRRLQKLAREYTTTRDRNVALATEIETLKSGVKDATPL